MLVIKIHGSTIQVVRKSLIYSIFSTYKLSIIKYVFNNIIRLHLVVCVLYSAVLEVLHAILEYIRTKWNLFVLSIAFF